MWAKLNLHYGSLETIFKNPIMIVIYMVVLFSLSWQLTLFVLLLLPFSGFFSLVKSDALWNIVLLRGKNKPGKLLSQIEETLGGLRVVKAFTAEEKLKARFAGLNDRIRKTFNRINRRYLLAHPISELLGTVVVAILLWYGGTQESPSLLFPTIRGWANKCLQCDRLVCKSGSILPNTKSFPSTCPPSVLLYLRYLVPPILCPIRRNMFLITQWKPLNSFSQ